MVGPALQVRFPTSLTDEEDVSRRAWNLATAPGCPWCRLRPHKLAPHGFYPRVKPPGTRIRRFRCQRKGRTVSALPDCLAARVTGSLEEVEAAAAVEQARPPGQGSLASAQRWLGRREQWVEGLLVTVKGLYPERFAGVEPTGGPVRDRSKGGNMDWLKKVTGIVARSVVLLFIGLLLSSSWSFRS